MIIQNCFYRVSIKALIEDDENRFLLAKEDNGTWDFPGGGLEFGENIQTALRREIQEELGINAGSIAESPKYFITFLKHNTDLWIANILLETTLDNFDFVPSRECVALKFFSPEEAKALPNSGGVSTFVDILSK